MSCEIGRKVANVHKVVRMMDEAMSDNYQIILSSRDIQQVRFKKKDQKYLEY